MRIEIVRRWIATILFLALFNEAQVRGDEDAIQEKKLRSRQAIIVVGASGESIYETEFRSWGERWMAACQKANINATLIDGSQSADKSEGLSDKAKVLQAIEQAKQASVHELWIVMLGHGTFDGKVGKFNLRGEDISAEELKGSLESLQSPLVLVNCFSSSGAFLPSLSKAGRIIVTSTKSGTEQNYSRFGDFLSRSVGDLSADLDHDRSVSILEAFLKAAKETAKFYDDEKRLATEHPLLDDSGDRQGVSADFFEGIRLVKKAEGDAVVDGEVAATSLLVPSQEDADLDSERLVKRDRLEKELRQLRRRKATMEIDQYYDKLEVIARELSLLYQ